MEHIRKTASRVLTLLEALAENKVPNVRLLEEKTGIPKSTVARLLADLTQTGWLLTDEGSYTPSARLALAARALSDPTPLLRHASPVMRHLAERTGKTALLSVRQGARGLCLHTEEPSVPLKFTARQGMEIPLDKSATGKILAAWAPAEIQKQLIERVREAEGAPAAAGLTLELEKARRHGWAFSQEEWISHAADLSVPLFNGRGEAVGQLGLAGLAGTFADLSPLIDELQRAAKTLGSKI